MDGQGGAVVDGSGLSAGNDGRERDGMPRHRIPLGAAVERRGMDVAIHQTAAHHGVLRWLHHFLHLHERRGGADGGEAIRPHDALSLR